MDNKILHQSEFPISSREEMLIEIGNLGFSYKENIDYSQSNFKLSQKLEKGLLVTHLDVTAPFEIMNLDCDPYDVFYEGSRISFEDTLYHDFQTILDAGYIKVVEYSIYQYATISPKNIEYYVKEWYRQYIPKK